MTVFGGSGFVGRHVVAELAKGGVSDPRCRYEDPIWLSIFSLWVVLVKFSAVQANLRFPWSVKRAIEGSDAVVNLVGILSQSGNQKFTNVHVRGARGNRCKIAKAVKPLWCMSARLGADDKIATQTITHQKVQAKK